MTAFCPNCGKPNMDTALACVACAHVLKRSVAEPKVAKPDLRVLVDEVEERAWVAFASGPPPPGVLWDSDRAERVAEWADKMLKQFRSRRRPVDKDGPYR